MAERSTGQERSFDKKAGVLQRLKNLVNPPFDKEKRESIEKGAAIALGAVAVAAGADRLVKYAVKKDNEAFEQQTADFNKDIEEANENENMRENREFAVEKINEHFGIKGLTGEQLSAETNKALEIPELKQALADPNLDRVDLVDLLHSLELL